VRENLKILGDLSQDFDFTQKPRPPMLLPTLPAKAIAPFPGSLGPLVDALTNFGP
jgi:hypothetical protein